jgi:hypothetical protein
VTLKLSKDWQCSSSKTSCRTSAKLVLNIDKLSFQSKASFGEWIGMYHGWLNLVEPIFSWF